MEILLETPRLVLREFTVDDVDELVALDADPRVMRFISNGAPTAREEVEREIIPAYLAYHRSTPDFGFWAAQARETGEFLGWFHLRPEPGTPPAEPELGYRLRHACWGRGLATEGSRALIDHAFGIPATVRVTANTMAVHTASRTVMERCGMTLVRSFRAEWPVRIDGDEAGDVEYAITRAGWLAGRPGPEPA